MEVKRTLGRLKKKCGYCGGNGWTLDNRNQCIHCGATPRKQTKVVSISDDDKQLNYIETIKTLNSFNINKFNETYKHLAQSPKFIGVCTVLNMLTSNILKGELADYSACIGMDDMEILDSYARTYIYTAHNSGKTVFPYLDGETIYGMYKNRDSTHLGYSFKDVLTSDVVCIKLLKSPQVYYLFDIIPYVVKARSTFGLPTLLFIDIAFKELVTDKMKEKIPSAKAFIDIFTRTPVTTRQYAKVVYKSIKD